MGALAKTQTYFEQVKGQLEEALGDLWPQLAFGLAGNGSECLGFDDEVSQDHDWGYDFYVWIADGAADKAQEVAAAKRRVMHATPPEHIRHDSAFGVGPRCMSVSAFYEELIGCNDRPADWRVWRTIPEENLAMAVNGEVFLDNAGDFLAVRTALLRHYPRDLRLKKMAARCMALAQTGQYNLARMERRGDEVAVHQTVARFVDEAEELAFLLERVYRPYYKWAWRALGELPRIGAELSEYLLQAVTTSGALRQAAVDCSCEVLSRELRAQDLVRTGKEFMTAHALELMEQIDDPVLRSAPAQYE